MIVCVAVFPSKRYDVKFVYDELSEAGKYVKSNASFFYQLYSYARLHLNHDSITFIKCPINHKTF